ncbi:MAG: hypothetical protein AB1593_10585, partial [Pseudomonadota bacterium]
AAVVEPAAADGEEVVVRKHQRQGPRLRPLSFLSRMSMSVHRPLPSSLIFLETSAKRLIVDRREPRQPKNRFPLSAN